MSSLPKSSIAMGITTKALQLDEIRATSAVEESTQC